MDFVVGKVTLSKTLSQFVCQDLEFKVVYLFFPKHSVLGMLVNTSDLDSDLIQQKIET